MVFIIKVSEYVSCTSLLQSHTNDYILIFKQHEEGCPYKV